MRISELVMGYEAPIRLGFFFGIFAFMAGWELLAPRRVLNVSKALRWANNLGIVVLNTVLLRLLFPAAAVGIALFAREQGWGLLNYFQLRLGVEQERAPCNHHITFFESFKDLHIPLRVVTGLYLSGLEQALLDLYIDKLPQARVKHGGTRYG